MLMEILNYGFELEGLKNVLIITIKCPIFEKLSYSVIFDRVIMKLEIRLLINARFFFLYKVKICFRKFN